MWFIIFIEFVTCNRLVFLILQQMIVLLDHEMSENSTFMHEFALRMAEYDIKYHITSHPTPTTIRWNRVTSHRSVDESAKVGELLVLWLL